jgi:hypothetical protein
MTSTRQQKAARPNIKNARSTWQAMSSRGRTRAQPKGRRRAKPGTTGKAKFFHIEVRPRREFKTFRTQDVGRKGGIERVAGRRSSGSWDTQKWLISKEHAHLRSGRLVADSEDAKRVLSMLGSKPVHLSGNRFKAKDRPNVPERAKPTPGQQRTQQRNIKKARAARRKRAA